jgi:hypothetical protein
MRQLQYVLYRTKTPLNVDSTVRFIDFSVITSEDHIRNLCSRALAAQDDSATLQPILLELRTALAEHIRGIRAMAAQEVPRAFSSKVLNPSNERTPRLEE